MLADDGREASATGFMKAQLNGDLILCDQRRRDSGISYFSGPGKKPAGSPNGFDPLL